MTNISALRKEIKTKFPDLKFKVRTISFEDLARDSVAFIESDEWGMTKGNQETFKVVQRIGIKYNAIAMW